MSVLYLDCSAGAAGDMILGALIDAGASFEKVFKAIELLGIPGVSVGTEEVHRAGLRATKLRVVEEGDQTIETYSAAEALIRSARLDPPITNRSLAVLSRLADAEARVHGVAAETVHFHELAAVDTVVDVVGCATAMDDLQISEVFASPVATGWGSVDTDHGPLPLPAPAVLELMKGAPLFGRDTKSELLTPTGAALLAEYVDSWGPMPSMIVEAAGYGAGEREFEFPNVVRALVGRSDDTSDESFEEVLIEANIDDMSPEIYSYVIQKLIDVGAGDAWLVPAIGKRGRPTTILTALAPPEAEQRVRDVLLTETSTIGLRARGVRKWALPRRWVDVEVEGHPIRVKIAERRGVTVNVAPEYSDCVRVAEATGLPLKTIFRKATEAAGGVRGE